MDQVTTSTNLNSCLALENGVGFYIGGAAVDTWLTNCIASGNGRGIEEGVGTTGTIIVDCRSQHAATAVNPAYNLNTNADVLEAGTVQVIIS
jgi:hypothetical protein